MYDTYEGKCFICGKENPIGLKLEFREENKQYITEFTPGEEHQGYPGIIHGGITAAILDEVSTRYILSRGILAFTGEINIRYRKRIPVGVPVIFKSWVTKEKGRIYFVEAEAILPDGTVAAQSAAKVMRASEPPIGD